MGGLTWGLEALECFSKLYTYVGVFEVICYLNVAQLNLLSTAAHLIESAVCSEQQGGVSSSERPITRKHPSSPKQSTRPLPALSPVFLLLQITVIWA